MKNIPADENSTQEKDDVEAKVEQLKSDLSVPRENMSATTRKLISAPDGRSSSFAMGTFASVSLSLVAAILLFSDLVRGDRVAPRQAV